MRTILLLSCLLLFACEREPEANYLKITYCYELQNAPDPVDKFAGELAELPLISVTRERVFIIDPVERQYISGPYLYVIKFEPL